jgi:hypothetical protein
LALVRENVFGYRTGYRPQFSVPEARYEGPGRAQLDTGRSMKNESLKPCGMRAARFPFRAQCRACGWSTDAVKLEAVATKLWNEAKRQGKARARSKLKARPERG